MTYIGLRAAVGVALSLTFVQAAHSQVGGNCFAHFSPHAGKHTWPNAYLCAFASYYAYREPLAAKNQSQYQSSVTRIFTGWGMTNFRFIDRGTKTGDTQATVMSNAGMVLVAFRGSEMREFVKDWITTDGNVDKLSGPPWSPGKVHRGIGLSLNDAYHGLLTILRDPNFANRPIWITGHSLGGGLSTLAAYRLKQEGFPVQGVYTFGAPRVGEQGFADAFARLKIRLERYVNATDIVCMVPDSIVLGYRHVGVTNNIAYPLSGFDTFHTLGGLTAPRPPVIHLNAREVYGLGNPLDHDMLRYLHAIYTVMTAKTKRTLLPRDMPIPPV